MFALPTKGGGEIMKMGDPLAKRDNLTPSLFGFVAPSKGSRLYLIGTLLLKQSCTSMVCDVPLVRFSPSLRRSCLKIGSHFTSNCLLLGYHEYYIYYDIARESCQCVLAPPGLALRSKCCGRGATTKVTH